MKKILAAGIAATAVLSSCSMPWSKETPSDLPPPVAPAAVQGPAEGPNPNVPQPAPTTNGSGAIEPGIPVIAGPDTAAPTATGTGKQATLTGAAEDAEVNEAVGEIDKLFDGIAGSSGSTKK